MMSERRKPLVQRNNLNDKMNATIHLKIKSGRKIRYNWEATFVKHFELLQDVDRWYVLHLWRIHFANAIFKFHWDRLQMQ